MTAPGWSTGEEDSTVAALLRAVDKHADDLFLDFSGETYTYSDVERESARIAVGLRELGVQPGDRVICVLDNNLDAVATTFGIQRLGAIHVAVNTAYKGEFLRHQIADSGAKVVIAESDYVHRVLRVVDGTPELEVILHRGSAPEVETGPRVEALDSYRLDGDRNFPTVRPGDVGAFIYTAGTTGPSKGCVLPHNYLMLVAQTMHTAMDRTPDEHSWTPLPLFHLNAVASVLGTVQLGGSLSIAPRFSLSGFWPEIERSGARVVNVLGTMIPLIANMPDTEEMQRCRGQIRSVFGVPFTEETTKAWRERFDIARVGAPGYGLTEAAIAITGKVGSGPIGTSGRQNPLFDVRIVDEEDHEVPVGTPGEIVFRPLRPNTMFRGYWNRPDATLAVMSNLWFHTGDVGKFDEDGWFTFVDRKKDYLRRGGENISSFEMETTLMTHGALKEVAVHAVFSELAEDDVKITAVLHDDAVLTEEELCRWSIDHLPYFAVPRYIEFRTELPKNPVGRVLKYELRDDGVTAKTWDRQAAGITFAKR